MVGSSPKATTILFYLQQNGEAYVTPEDGEKYEELLEKVEQILNMFEQKYKIDCITEYEGNTLPMPAYLISI